MHLSKAAVTVKPWCKLLTGGGSLTSLDRLWKGGECCTCNGTPLGESKVGGANCCWVWEGIALGEGEGGDIIGCGKDEATGPL